MRWSADRKDPARRMARGIAVSLLALTLGAPPTGAEAAEVPGAKKPRGDAKARGAAGGQPAPLNAKVDGPTTEQIQQAIDRGREHLLRVFERIVQKAPADYPMGNIALPLAALLRSGLPSDHVLVQRALKDLEQRPLEEVYSVTCYLMALDAYSFAVAREAMQKILKGGTQAAAPAPPAPPDADKAVKARMEESVRWLLQARNQGQGNWHYRKEGGHDNSNTQFAVLGLQIGLEHKIPMPREVFQEIARHFATSLLREKDSVEFSITRTPRKLFTSGTGENPRKLFRLPVGGWGYTKNDRLPYASMTAAGASSLLVARGALGSNLFPAAAGAIDASLGWIAHNLDRFLDSAGHPYYTLYSLEKVGDIGDIALFNERDWYREGAGAILRRQNGDGSWGGAADTSFALLFLTRATRPSFRASPPPRVVTGAGALKDEAAGDLVYIDSLGGAISAREFFDYLQASGDRSLLKMAAEVVERYPLHRRGELVPLLLPLWMASGDSIRAFAKKSLTEVTGETWRTSEEYRRWHEAYLAVRTAESAASNDPERIAVLLAGAPGQKLKGRLLEVISRQGLVACGPAVIEEVRFPSPAHSQRACEILSRLLGAEPSGLSSQSAADRETAAQAWSALWAERGKGALAAARIRRSMAVITRTGPTERGGPSDGTRKTAALEALIQEGRPAVPFILEVLEGPGFPAHLLEALERISGQRLGLRPASWKAWWAVASTASAGSPAGTKE